MLNEAPLTEVAPAEGGMCVSCDRAGAAVELRKGELEVVRCASCGHLYLASWRSELARFDELYGYFHDRKGSLERRTSPINARRLAELLGELGAEVAGRRLLDVGAGEGKLVHAACRLGWDARGIDLSEHAVASCREEGLPIERLDFFDARLSDERFDVISMCELLEHVPHPARFLSRAEELLDEGGILYFTTPNFDALSRRALGAEWRMFHPQHISYFTEPFLRRTVLEQTRFEIVVLETRNLSIGNLLLAARRRKQNAAVARVDVTAPLSTDARKAWDIDQRVRRLVQTRAGASVKRWTNAAVALGGVGDTIVGVLRKAGST
jgi:2-polyprenyl-3-methyl-5-hydroxy-6-metoxy-1,4-benzoquinol methylase